MCGGTIGGAPGEMPRMSRRTERRPPEGACALAGLALTSETRSGRLSLPSGLRPKSETCSEHAARAGGKSNESGQRSAETGRNRIGRERPPHGFPIQIGRKWRETGERTEDPICRAPMHWRPTWQHPTSGSDFLLTSNPAHAGGQRWVCRLEFTKEREPFEKAPDEPGEGDNSLRVYALAAYEECVCEWERVRRQPSLQAAVKSIHRSAVAAPTAS